MAAEDKPETEGCSVLGFVFAFAKDLKRSELSLFSAGTLLLLLCDDVPFLVCEEGPLDVNGFSTTVFDGTLLLLVDSLAICSLFAFDSNICDVGVSLPI